jgi:hypothetical protein
MRFSITLLSLVPGTNWESETCNSVEIIRFSPDRLQESIYFYYLRYTRSITVASRKIAA